MKLLCDGDGIVFRAGFATDKTRYAVCSTEIGQWSLYDDAKAAKEYATKCAGILWSRKEAEPEDKAIMLADVMLNEIKARYASENPETIVYLGGVGNFRHGIATRSNYKQGRGDRPKHYKAIRDHLLTQWGGVLSAGEEADDMIAREALASPGSVICTQDKDLRSIPGRFYNFVTKEEETIGPKEAALNFYAQVLSGDAVDSVPGVTGVGPVRARKILADCKSPLDAWSRIVDVYSKEFGDKGYEYALECARLVKVGMPKGVLWSPPA